MEATFSLLIIVFSCAVPDETTPILRTRHRGRFSKTARLFWPANGAEAAAEVGWRDAGHRSDRSHVERLGVGAIYCVSGAEQAPVEISTSRLTRQRYATRCHRSGFDRAAVGNRATCVRGQGPDVVARLAAE
jgi:hypothetical protein